MRWGQVILPALVAACGPEPAHRGTFEPHVWAEMETRPAVRGLGAVVRAGEVAILEGDHELVSGVAGALGLRFDAERNDLGRVMARYASQVADVPGVLVVFTTFPDIGAAGPAYFVPVWNEVSGTGMARVDQRADFGASLFEGFVNMKQLDGHDAIHLDLAHELAHRHLAYMRALPASSTVTIDLTGRQGSHWRATVDSRASLLGGYAWMETTPGRFLVTGAYEGFSELDLYGLGLMAADEVAPFYVIAGATTEAGFELPPAAELVPGSRALGTRVDLGVEDVVRALGPRDPGQRELRAVFALLTAPGESATSTVAAAHAVRVDEVRVAFEGEWAALTRGRGAVCTRVRGCAVAGDGGVEVPRDEDASCSCRARRGGGGAWVLVLVAAWSRWRRRR